MLASQKVRSCCMSKVLPYTGSPRKGEKKTYWYFIFASFHNIASPKRICILQLSQLHSCFYSIIMSVTVLLVVRVLVGVRLCFLRLRLCLCLGQMLSAVTGRYVLHRCFTIQSNKVVGLTCISSPPSGIAILLLFSLVSFSQLQRLSMDFLRHSSLLILRFLMQECFCSSVMINFVCQFDWAMECLDRYLVKLYSGYMRYT